MRTELLVYIETCTRAELENLLEEYPFSLELSTRPNPKNINILPGHDVDEHPRTLLVIDDGAEIAPPATYHSIGLKPNLIIFEAPWWLSSIIPGLSYDVIYEMARHARDDYRDHLQHTRPIG